MRSELAESEATLAGADLRQTSEVTSGVAVRGCVGDHRVHDLALETRVVETHGVAQLMEQGVVLDPLRRRVVGSGVENRVALRDLVVRDAAVPGGVGRLEAALTELVLAGQVGG